MWNLNAPFHILPENCIAQIVNFQKIIFIPDWENQNLPHKKWKFLRATIIKSGTITTPHQHSPITECRCTKNTGLIRQLATQPPILSTPKVHWNWPMWEVTRSAASRMVLTSISSRVSAVSLRGWRTRKAISKRNDNRSSEHCLLHGTHTARCESNSSARLTLSYRAGGCAAAESECRALPASATHDTQ